jgi:hypothetical protein
MGAMTTNRTLGEVEIRRHVQRAFNAESGPSSGLTEADRRARRGAIAWEDAWQEVAEVVDSLWDTRDLRDSEERRLSELEHEAIAGLRDEVRPKLLEALVGAAVSFSREFSDAPLRPAPGD